MANTLNPGFSYYTSQERQPATVPELPNDQPHQSFRQSHCEDHTEQTEATGGEDHCRRTCRLQSRKEHHRADLQPTNPLLEISPAPVRPLPCLHRLQEGLRRGLACSFVGNHEKYISANLIRVIKNLFDKAISAVSTAYGVEISAEKTNLMTTPVASTQRSK